MRIEACLASKEFWYCNLVGWAIYILVDAGSVYLHNNDFWGQFTHSVFIAACGVLLGLCYRHLARKKRFHAKHPLVLIPLSVLLSIVFGNFITVMDYAVLRGYGIYHSFIDVWLNSADYFWFPFVISQWIGTSHILLIWLLLFNLIQAERRIEQSAQKITVLAKFMSILSIYFFIELFHVLVSLAYSEPESYSFSWDFIVDNLYTLLTGVVFAALVLLLKPYRQIFKSRLLAALPSVVFLVFCTSFFCMISFSLLPYRDELWQGSWIDLPRNIASILTSKSQLWIDKHQFIGTLHSRLQTQTLVILMYLYFIYGIYRLEKYENDNKLEWLFWLYNTAGWSILCGYLYFSNWLNWESVSHEFARNMLLSLMIGGLFTGLLMRTIIRRQQLLENRIHLFIGKSLILAFGMGLLLTGGLWLTGYVLAFASENTYAIQIYEELINTNNFFVPVLAVTSLGCFMWILIYEKSVSQRNKTASQIKQLQMEKNMKDLQLNLLAGKVDPHFIFNALNNIRGLIREDAERAREAILVLSEMLRRPLTEAGAKIKLADELALARHYIHLWKIQLEARLDYQEILHPDLENALIPPMFLQILMENAIKHGIAQLPDGGKLTLNIFEESKQLHCVLTNTGNIQSDRQGFGLGLSNLRERLSLLYTGNTAFTLTEVDNEVVAHLVLPLELVQ
jgi:two-component system, LytTR family, sensor kinase